MKIPAALANAIVVLVTLVWAGNFIASVLVQGYESDAALNFVFMTIVGGMLALRGPDDGGPGLASRLLSAIKPPPPPPPPAAPPPPSDEERAP